MQRDPSAPLRVAAYCRVSTDKEDQRNSLAAQRQYFENYIAGHPGWTLAEVFADEGLSGTTVRRPQFARLLRRALAGEIDLILTKEVSRFARNTVDALQVTRLLRERGVGVRFLSDGISTLDSDGEFRLTIMASVAQEESRKISERTRWGQLQAMRRGVVFGNDSLYGYTLRGGVLTLRPDQAEVVRRVYRLFLEEGMGAAAIARTLTGSGVTAPQGGERWSPAMVLRLLRNEKYTGDLLQKKYRTTDHLTHRKIPNDRPEEQFCLRDHHQAVVSREQFRAVQAELARRRGLTAGGRGHSARYWYSGKVVCGGCGRSFTVKRTRRKDGGEYLRFVCRGRLEGTCAMGALPGRVLLGAAEAVAARLGLEPERLLRRALRELEAEGAGDGEARRREQILRQLARRRERALEAFLAGALSRERLEELVARCREEEGTLARRMEERTAPPPTEDLPVKELLLWESIRRVTVWEDCLEVEPQELPLCFRLELSDELKGRRVKGSGRKREG